VGLRTRPFKRKPLSSIAVVLFVFQYFGKGNLLSFLLESEGKMHDAFSCKAVSSNLDRLKKASAYKHLCLLWFSYLTYFG